MTLKKKQQVAVGGLIFNQSHKLLFVKRAHDDEFMPGIWEIPGGGTEIEESPTDGLAREIFEECGLSVKPLHEPLAWGEYIIERNGERIHRVEITFMCRLLDKYQDIILSDEHEEYQWISIDELDSIEMTDYMRKLVKDSLAKINYQN